MLRNKLRILVAGALINGDKQQQAQIEEFARLLAKEVITQGHSLLTACRNSFDRVVAESANEAVRSAGGNPIDWIISYVPRDVTPVHKFGNVHESEVEDW